MKRPIVLIMLLMFTLILPQQVMATTDKYDLAYTCEKDGSGWCYAACSKSTISQYHGSSPTQTSIARYVQFGDENSSNIPDITEGATVDELKDVLNHWEVSCSRKFDSLSETAVKSQIAGDHLIHSCFYYDSTLNSHGHDELVFGWTDTWGTLKIGYMEPDDGDIYWTPWDDFSTGAFLNSPSWSWYASVFDCEEI